MIHCLVQPTVLNVSRDHSPAKHIVSAPIFSGLQLFYGTVQVICDSAPRSYCFVQLFVLNTQRRLLFSQSSKLCIFL
ncbi:hypothetical protein D3C77_759340 [compost metagenome]